MNIIIPPGKAWVEKALNRSRGQEVKWVYLGENLSEAILLEDWFSTRGTRIHIARRLQEMAENLRDAYITYIGRLSQELSSIKWWAGELSEKNPTISKVMRNVCYLKICEEITMDSFGGDTVFVVENYALRQSLFCHLQRAGVDSVCRFESVRIAMTRYTAWMVAVIRHMSFVIENVYRIWVTHWIMYRHRKKAVSDRTHIIKNELTVLHAWLDSRSISEDGTYRDAYFGKMGDALQTEGNQVVYLAYVLQTLSYADALRRLAKSDKVFLLPHTFLKAVDFVRVALRNLLSKPDASETYPPFDSVEVTGLINDESLRFWSEARMVYPLMRHELVRRWREAGIRIHSFVYPFEGMRWEKVFCMALKRYFPKAIVTGYAHSSFSLMALNHFFSKDERELVPQPDRLLVNGETYVDLFRCSAYRSRIVNVGAMRYAHLFTGEVNGIPSQREPDDRPPRVLVTTSIDRDTALELILKAVEALKDQDGFDVVIKCHPVMPYHALHLPDRLKVLPPHFQISDAPITVLLKDASVLLYSDSTTALEAIALNVPVIQVSSDYSIDMDPLDIFPEIRRKVYSPEEVAYHVRNILEMDQESSDKEMAMAREKVFRMFNPVSEQSYAAIVT